MNISINNYLLERSRLVIDGINNSLRYKRELIDMIARSVGQIPDLDHVYSSTPTHIEYLNSIQNIEYDKESNMYIIHTKCTISKHNTYPYIKSCDVGVPVNVFNMTSEDIETYYNDLYIKDIQIMINDIEAYFKESLKNLKSIKAMIESSDNISKIGGEIAS